MVRPAQTPTKQWIIFEHSGHVPQFEEFDRFRHVLRGILQAPEMIVRRFLECTNDPDRFS